MSLRILNADAVSAALSHARCIEVLRPTMISVARRQSILPLRQFLVVPGTQGKMGLMPGYVDLGANPPTDQRSFGVKIVSKFPRAPGSPHGTHVGAVMVFDADEGIPLALLDGGRLTAIRTAAASALATDALARPDSSTVLFLGHGEEAQHHIPALLAVRPVSRFLIWGRNPDRVSAFVAQHSAGLPNGVRLDAAPDLQAALVEADIVCTLTSAQQPILPGALLRPGQHINLVGAAVATSAEADGEVVRRARFYTDFRPSLEAQAGEWIDALKAGIVTQSHLAGEIGEVLGGSAPGRTGDQDITVYKSLGVAAQDLAAGLAAHRFAEAEGLGQLVDW